MFLVGFDSLKIRAILPMAACRARLQVGLLTPEPTPTGELRTGQVGYVITGMKSARAARVGDTWHRAKHPVPLLPGFKASKSMVFAGGCSSTKRLHCPGIQCETSA